MDYLIGHLVGDYLLQTHWMAMNKRAFTAGAWKERRVVTESLCRVPFGQWLNNSLWPLALHCVMYTGAVILLTGWWSIWPAAIIFTIHFIQDGTNFISWFMKIKGSGKWAADFAPWPNIIVDNVLHLCVLYSIARWVI